MFPEGCNAIRHRLSHLDSLLGAFPCQSNWDDRKDFSNRFKSWASVCAQQKRDGARKQMYRDKRSAEAGLENLDAIRDADTLANQLYKCSASFRVQPRGLFLKNHDCSGHHSEMYPSKRQQSRLGGLKCDC